MNPTEIEAIVRSYYENLAAMNPEAVLAHFAADAISHDPVGEPPAKVHEGFKEFIGRLQMVFESLETAIESIFFAPNSAAVKWTTQGISKSGKTVTFAGITIFEMNEDGKIHTTRAYWNPAAMLAQLRG
ncbi:nuclear transport factor 2 family protein [Calothrix sp. 336/3]|uniref:nuclear transport factor 2 family protein n=1 Tax=Calothrix sp. 336/3 TaxID=1337936 RepID=UPI0004E40241|nr:nuclear transport factor 2 family protein [Calothrix sp. 336/3]AKG23779.1 ketosteroid isomerase [Calothrix sp. 336/3]